MDKERKMSKDSFNLKKTKERSKKMKSKNVLLIIVSTCFLLVSCYKEGGKNNVDCKSFQKKAKTEKDISTNKYNTVQSVFYHVGGWSWRCCFNTQSGLKESDSLKVCGYVVKKIPKNRYSDYYISPCDHIYFRFREMYNDFYQKHALYKICDISQDIAPYIIVGIDINQIDSNIINAIVGQKDKKLYLKGQCYLLNVGDSLLNKDVAPGYNVSTAKFVLPYLVVSDSSDIEIRKEY